MCCFLRYAMALSLMWCMESYVLTFTFNTLQASLGIGLYFCTEHVTFCVVLYFLAYVTLEFALLLMLCMINCVLVVTFNVVYVTLRDGLSFYCVVG